ncbi:hypothetical protein [Marininema halotolerans]|uniref:tRNA_anti-like n=1 Tax=Marininema halotolerans TaxID=1155944 RepID=A0A1I6NVQ3_9BACL|nr:hypothetical protein [Marininema halotolerans]SFS31980.1 hypothetical protein SAMN05444972_101173 [Marininema halotolerans]
MSDDVIRFLLLLGVPFFLVVAIFGAVLWIKPMPWGKRVKLYSRIRAATFTIVALFLGLSIYWIASLNGVDYVDAMMGAHKTPQVEKSPQVKCEITNDQFATTHDHFTLKGKVDSGTEVEINGFGVFGQPKVKSDGTFSYEIKTKRVADGTAQYKFKISANKKGKEANNKIVVITRELSGGKEQDESTKALAHLDNVSKTINYQALKKDANKNIYQYRRASVKYTGQISEIREEEFGSTVMLLNVTKDQQGKWKDPVIVRLEGRVVDKAKGDMITVYGKVGTEYSNESLWDRDIPAVDAIRMK